MHNKLSVNAYFESLTGVFLQLLVYNAIYEKLLNIFFNLSSKTFGYENHYRPNRRRQLLDNLLNFKLRQGLLAHDVLSLQRMNNPFYFHGL